jgi:Trk K+ transport system NAD-binding subunit
LASGTAWISATTAGAGNVGVSIASDLRVAGHQVLLIEQDTDVVAKLRSTLAPAGTIVDL